LGNYSNVLIASISYPIKGKHLENYSNVLIASISYPIKGKHLENIKKSLGNFRKKKIFPIFSRSLCPPPNYFDLSHPSKILMLRFEIIVSAHEFQYGVQ